MKILRDYECKDINNIVEIKVGKKEYGIAWGSVASAAGMDRRDIGFMNVRVHDGICTIVFGSYNKKTSKILAWNMDKAKIIYAESVPGAVVAICINGIVAAITDKQFGVLTESEINFCVKGLRCKKWTCTPLGCTNDSDLLNTDYYILETRSNMLCYGTLYNRHFTYAANRKKMINGIMYSNYEDWMDGGFYCEGVPQPDSIYIFTDIRYTGPGGISLKYVAQSPEYVAGFIKYIYLGTAFTEEIISERERKRARNIFGTIKPFIPNIDVMIDLCSKRDRKKAKLITKFKKAIAMCEQIFTMQSRSEQITALKRTADYINSVLCSDEYWESFGTHSKITICDGAKEAYPEFMYPYSLDDCNNELSDVLEKDEWTDEDSGLILSEILTV